MDLFKPILSGFWFNFVLFFWRALVCFFFLFIFYPTNKYDGIVGEILKIIVTDQSVKKHINEDSHQKPRPVICEGVSLIKGPSETHDSLMLFQTSWYPMKLQSGEGFNPLPILNQCMSNVRFSVLSVFSSSQMIFSVL